MYVFVYLLALFQNASVILAALLCLDPIESLDGEGARKERGDKKVSEMDNLGEGSGK